IGAETSPVKAPSLLQETFWPEMAMLVPFVASAAVEMAVKGGATMMSQCLEFATNGVKAEKNARVSSSVLYIFQLPAITGRRMTRPPRARRTGRNSCPTRAKECVCSFVGEGFDAGELASGEKFQGSAAAGGDMGDFVREAGPMNGCDGIAAADNGRGAGAGGGSDGFGDLERAFRESGHLEYAHGTVPDDGFCGGNFLTIGFDGLGTDIEAHPAFGCSGDGDGLRRGVRFEFRADDVIDGKQERKFLLPCFVAQSASKFQLVIFDERFADGLAVGFEKSVSHAAADEHGIRNFHQVFDDFDFVADFGTAENRDEGTRRIGHGFAEVGQLSFHEQPRRCLRDEARYERSRRRRKRKRRHTARRVASKRLRRFFLRRDGSGRFPVRALPRRARPCFGLRRLDRHNPGQRRSACRAALPIFWRRASENIWDPGRLWAGRDAKQARAGRPFQWRGAVSAEFRGCVCRR